MRHEDCFGQEAGEPEDHGHAFGGQDPVLVCGGGEVAWADGEVGQRYEGGPDAGEDKEIDAAGRGMGACGVVPGCDCRVVLADVVVGALFTEFPHTIAIQAEDQNGEEELRSAQGDHEVDAHS